MTDGEPGAEVVEFGGLALRPRDYREQTEDGALIVSFVATLTADETATLRTLQVEREYWPVVRRGVSDEPVRMRLGTGLWQRRDDGGTEHQVTLVEDVWDANIESLAHIGEPQSGNLIRVVSSLCGQFDELLRILEDRELLDAQGVQTIRQAGSEATGTRGHVFLEVEDLEKWK